MNRTMNEISMLDNHTLLYELIELAKENYLKNETGIIWRKSELLNRLENKL